MARTIKQVFSKDNPIDEIISTSSSNIITDIGDPNFDEIISSLLIDFKPEQKKERQYILREKVIDQFNIKRERKLLTPDTCIECTYTVLDAVNRKNGTNLVYDELSEEKQIIVLDLLERHKELIHPLANKRIITESELLQLN